MNYSSSSMYYNSSSSSSNYQSDFQNPQFDQFPSSASNASAPPDPSFYHSSDYFNNTYYPNDHHHHNVTWYDQTPVQAVRFDDYGRPITSVLEVPKNDQTVYNNGGGTKKDQSPSALLRFDDYGRPITYGNQTRNDHMDAATPNEDVTNGVRVILLSEGGGGDTTDVLCQVITLLCCIQICKQQVILHSKRCC